MPLSAAASRQPTHTRTIDCRGFARDDGLFDIEGHLTDVKGIDLQGDGHFKGAKPGDIVHDMWVRITIDIDMVIHDIEVCTDRAPYPGCPDIASSFKSLIGARIAAGWNKTVRERVGGIKGCMHLINLLGPVANAAYQSTVHVRLKREHELRVQFARDGVMPPAPRPYQLASCHMYGDGSEATRARWPYLYPKA